MTLSEAIRAEGGLKPNAYAKGVALMREGFREPFVIDLVAIERGLAPDVAIKENDVIFIRVR